MSEIDFSPVARVCAACIAVVAWTGLIVQFKLLYSANSSVGLSLWIMLFYFTITTNLLVAMLFSWIAIKGRSPSGVLAGTMLNIVLVGVINALLLWGALELSGGSALVDKLLHVTTPLLVPLFWVIFAVKGRLTWRDPLWWAIYPLAYFGYGVVRGALTGKYPYPFMNVASLGLPRTTLNAVLIAAAFMASAYVVVWVDRRLGRRALLG